MKAIVWHIEEKGFQPQNQFLDTLAFNMVAEQVNRYLNELEEKELYFIRFEAVRHSILEATKKFDPKNDVIRLKEIADSIIDDIRNCEYEL